MNDTEIPAAVAVRIYRLHARHAKRITAEAEQRRREQEITLRRTQLLDELYLALRPLEGLPVKWTARDNYPVSGVVALLVDQFRLFVTMKPSEDDLVALGVQADDQGAWVFLESEEIPARWTVAEAVEYVVGRVEESFDDGTVTVQDTSGEEVPGAGRRVADFVKSPLADTGNEPAFDPSAFVKIAADDIASLRRCDVFRLLDSLQADDRRDAMAAYIRDHRSDLVPTVKEALQVIGKLEF